MRTPICVGVLLLALAGMLSAGGPNNTSSPVAASSNAAPDKVAPTPAPERRPVDLVICLDTSGSMTELIDSARAKLWDVVNELALAQPTPQLRVGLLTYGSPKLSTADRGWIVRQIDLTGDLDAVYSKMMAMTTDGGDEYVGWVLSDAVHTMSWSPDPEALKLIFVAGNESADQAVHRYDFRQVAQQARTRALVVNAIFAGDHGRGVAELWDQVAQYGGGHYAAIDAKKGTVQVSTPQDETLRQLNGELNATYLPYGPKGEQGAANQVDQDRNAYRMGVQSGSSRGAAKASPLYENAAWDLVDASAEADFELAEVAQADLPEDMRSMTVEERKAYTDGMRAARAAIQKKILQVSAERERFLKAQRDKRNPKASALDEAMRHSIRTQAAEKGFTFIDGAAEPAPDTVGQTESGDSQTD